ncbi:MAG: cytochrome c biogenesis protein CcdA [Chloroflexi bacterium]|nr:cytochrome c biogenesis protein CcdA [Chloroflexota bacterium]
MAESVVAVSWVVAFAAGLLSFLSPCVVPIVPGYLSLVSGVAIGSAPCTPRQTERVTIASVLFVLGFSLVFVTLGAAASVLGGYFEGLKPGLARVAGLLMIVMGLFVLGVVRLPFLYRERRFQFIDRPYGPLGTVLIGMAFGLGWTPCIGPVLGSILLYAGAVETARDGALLLLAYSLGLGVPFVLAALALSRAINALGWARRHMPVLNAASGGLLVVLGLLFVSNQTYLLAYLSSASERWLSAILR